MVRALTSHQCGAGSHPGVDSICGLSLLLVLSLAPRGFSLCTPETNMAARDKKHLILTVLNKNRGL